MQSVFMQTVQKCRLTSDFFWHTCPKVCYQTLWLKYTNIKSFLSKLYCAGFNFKIIKENGVGK